jgi:hypothetical protein
MKYLVFAGSAALGTVVLIGKSLCNYQSSLQLFLYLFLAQLVAYLSYTIFIYPFYRSPLRHLPGPQVSRSSPSLLLPIAKGAQNGNFFFGQTLRFLQADGPNDLPLEFMERNPCAPLIRYLHVLNSEWILVNSVEACKEVLQTKCYDLAKPKFFNRIVGEIAGIGLVRYPECNFSPVLLQFSHTFTNLMVSCVGKHRGWGAQETEEATAWLLLLNLFRSTYADHFTGPTNTISVRKLVGLFNSKAEDLARTVMALARENPTTSIDGTYTFTV